MRLIPLNLRNESLQRIYIEDYLNNIPFLNLLYRLDVSFMVYRVFVQPSGLSFSLINKIHSDLTSVVTITLQHLIMIAYTKKLIYSICHNLALEDTVEAVSRLSTESYRPGLGVRHAEKKIVKMLINKIVLERITEYIYSLQS